MNNQSAMPIIEEDLEIYTELLLTRDRLEKEADSLLMAYTRVFGEAQRDAFQAKLDCIALKKAITYCQTVRNRGQEPDPLSMQEYIDAHMTGYYAQLESMIQNLKVSQGGTAISLSDAADIKKIYRRLAKRLHPDLSPLTEQYPELKEWFQTVMDAYRRNDLKKLRETELLINHFLESMDEACDVLPQTGWAEAIQQVEEEINRIQTTEPYCFRELLEDEEAVEQKKQELRKELEESLAYKAELQKVLDGMLSA